MVVDEVIWALGARAAINDEIWHALFGRGRPRRSGLRWAFTGRKTRLREAKLRRQIWSFVAAHACCVAHAEAGALSPDALLEFATECWRESDSNGRALAYIMRFASVDECVHDLCELGKVYLDEETRAHKFSHELAIVLGVSGGRELGLHAWRVVQFATMFPSGPMMQEFRRQLKDPSCEMAISGRGLSPSSS